MKKQDIEKLSSAERVAGYLARMAAIAYCGARLRSNGRTDEDWTPEEQLEWDRLVDDSDPWFQAMTPTEFQAIEKVDSEVLAPLCRGEWPLPKPLSQIPEVIKRECKECGELAYLTKNTCANCK